MSDYMQRFHCIYNHFEGGWLIGESLNKYSNRSDPITHYTVSTWKCANLTSIYSKINNIITKYMILYDQNLSTYTIKHTIILNNIQYYLSTAGIL